jgi:excisionase family DNA binding protein
MGLFDYLKTQFLEIIQWEDDSRDTLSWRFPDEDKEIKRGAQLIVRESQTAQFVYLGQFGDTFGPGKHALTTDNIPILSTLKGWKYGFESPFKADIYYVNTRLFTGNKWGTSNPIMMRDADFGIVRARAFGTYDFKIVDVKTFLREVAGTDHQFRLDEFNDTMRSRVVSVFSDALATAKVPLLDIAARYSELGEALLPLINPPVREKYGLELASFIVENVSLPPEVEQAIDKRSSMAAIGNLNDYVKFQMAEGLGKGTGGGTAGSAAEIAMGFGMAQQMMNQPGGLFATQATPPAGGAPVSVGAGAASNAGGPPPLPGANPATPAISATQTIGLPELLSPADVAKILSVTEADVVATLTDGSLKGKMIGSTWRVTRAALDEFLRG